MWKDINNVVKLLFVLFLINLVITSCIDRFVNSEKTETELFNNIENSFFWNFNHD